jgi:hypothetical protein
MKKNEGTRKEKKGKNKRDGYRVGERGAKREKRKKKK